MLRPTTHTRRPALSQDPSQSFATRIVMAVVLASLASVLFASVAIIHEAYKSAQQSIATAQGTVLRSVRKDVATTLRSATRELETGLHTGFIAVLDDSLGNQALETLGLESWPIQGAGEAMRSLTLVGWRGAPGEHGLGVVADFKGKRVRGLLPTDLFDSLPSPFGDSGMRVRLFSSMAEEHTASEEMRIESDHGGDYHVRRDLQLAAGWFARVEQPFSLAFTPIFALSARVFVIDCLLLSLVGIGAYLFARRVVAPIEGLTEDARGIARGTNDREIAERGSTWEVRTLSRSIRDMADALFRQHTDLEEANARLIFKNEELQAANEVLEQLSITDGLTKLHNHRFFQEQLTREIKRADRTGDPLSILICDIDDFKSLNDQRGHKAGDDLLKGLARILNESVRESDFLARYGGEEFVVLAAQTDVEGAIRLAEKVRTTVQDSSFIMDGSSRPGRTTISIGVAQYRGSRTGFFRAADQALYRAKASGKNCVVAEDREAP